MLPHSRISFDESLKKYGSSESFKFVAPLESCKRGTTPPKSLRARRGLGGSNPPLPRLHSESLRARRGLGGSINNTHSLRARPRNTDWCRRRDFDAAQEGRKRKKIEEEGGERRAAKRRGGRGRGGG